MHARHGPRATVSRSFYMNSSDGISGDKDFGGINTGT